ncbi:MAG: hypothetical protein KA314_28060 [Chloroflexi bacterium]|nr:hypothetical protein [Chloroflexota bacterium]MBP8059712.1 hypothetical protein [Chloroflexota bacterium]
MNALLQQGIQAAKAGDREQARRLLLQLVETDENNEQAWLWLGGVMETWEERRICLENVLALNPDNEVAQRGLARLNAAAPADATSLVQEQTKTAISPAAAILYPERHIQQREDTPLLEDDRTAQPLPVEFTHDSRYDDVWNSKATLCAFCAAPITEEATRCPQCRHRLIGWHLRYPQPTARFYNYIIILIGLVQFFFVDTLIDLSLQKPLNWAILHGLLSVVVISMVIAASMRHLWGHIGAILLSFFIVLLNGNLLFNQLQENPFAGYVGIMLLFLVAVSIALKFLQLLTALLVIGFGIFAVSPDFDQQQMHFVARVEKGHRDASEFHLLAKMYAQQGMWASAIMHWQFAAAHAPNHAQYQRELGSAYARLGFPERALDVLQSAHRLAGNPEVKTEIAQAITELKQKQNV